ncbi:MAG: hypothetical protein Q4G69_01215 [Planctomycetia bacterium]|nr:hypothetical protein [Planctomycetia bacterium]
MIDDKKIEELLNKDRRFTPESYKFVEDALDFAQKKLLESSELPAGEKAASVSGSDYCQAVCDLALERFGYLARTVLAGLGIRKTGDIGDIVYLLIEVGLLQEVPGDSRSDFDNVFDLAAKLQKEFSFSKNK